jgi:molybdate transport system substrate-binding protein
MEAIAEKYRAETGVEVNLVFAGAGTLLSQIEMSRKGDIYLPPSHDYIDAGESRGLLVKGSDRIVAYLVPAVITPAGNPAGIESLEDLAREGVRVGMGNPEVMCLGLYAVEILEKCGLLEPVLKNVVAFGATATSLASMLVMGQADAVIGWRVFHYWNRESMDFVPIAPEKIPRIATVSIAIPVHTKDMELSRSFIDFVLSPAGMSAYESLGYITSREEALVFAPNAVIGGAYTLPDRYFELIKQRVHVQ